jgi:pimeloyl-ACP methyl ester carboxylesterase
VVPTYAQSQRWWYQWFLTVDGGAQAFRDDPLSFALCQWQTWSPTGWFDDAEFRRTAESFRNPDWADITLHGYRSRWRSEPLDARYTDARARIDATEKLAVPILMLQGAEDHCDPPAESEGQERFFTAGYERVVMDHVGHFPAREAPGQVASLALQHLEQHCKR